MPTITRSSFIPFLFIAAYAGVCLFGQAKTALGQTINLTVNDASIGVFAGELICVGNRPACKNERVVYVFESTGRADQMLVTSDFIRGGVRVPFFRQTLQRDHKTNYFNGRFLTARDLMNSADEGTTARAVGGLDVVYTITVTARDAAGVEGTISLTDSKTVVRRIKLKRVEPDQVPTAPSPSMYQSR